MHLYSAEVTSAFLEKLSKPKQSPRHPSPLLVHITTVPLKPCSSLRDRLFALLLPPSKGTMTSQQVSDEETTRECGNEPRRTDMVETTVENDPVGSNQDGCAGKGMGCVVTEQRNPERTTYLESTLVA